MRDAGVRDGGLRQKIQATRLMKLQESIDRVEDHLRALDDQQFDQLSFEWEGIYFEAVTEEVRGNTAQIRLSADLGQLYFTIENSSHRTRAIESLYTNNRSVDGAYLIDSKGRVMFQSLTTTDKKLTGKELIMALTTILLQSGAHLRTLRSHLKPAKIAA